MALKRQPLHIVPAGGLDTETAPYHVTPGKWVTLENARQVRAGEYSKRSAVGAAIGTSFASITNAIGRDLYVRPDGYLVRRISNTTNELNIGSTRIHATGDGVSWRSFNDNLTDALSTARRSQLTEAAAGYIACDGARTTIGTNDYYLVAGVTSTGRVDYTITESSSGRVVIDGVLFITSGARDVRIIPITSGWVMLVCTPNTGATPAQVVAYRSLNGAAFGSGTTVFSDGVAAATGTCFWDAMKCTTNGMITVAYRNAAASFKIVELSYSGMTIGARTATVAAACDRAIGWLTLQTEAGSLYLGVCSAASACVTYELAMTNFATTGTVTYASSPTNATRVTGLRAGTLTQMMVERVTNDTASAGATTYRSVALLDFTGSGSGAGSTSPFLQHMNAALLVRPHFIDNLPYYVVATDDPVQPLAYLMRGRSVNLSGSVVQSVLPLDSSGVPPSTVLGGMSAATDGYTHAFSILGRTSFDISGGTFYGVAHPYDVAVDTDDSEWGTPADFGRTMYLPGGVIAGWDGNKIHAQPLGVPEISHTTVAGGGSLTVSSTYKHIVVMRWRNHQGEVFRSAPSLPVTSVLGAADTRVNVFVKQRHDLCVGAAAAGDVMIDLYRTLANPTDSSTYQLVMSAAHIPGSSSAFQLGDTVSDANLNDNEFLPTTGGILEFRPTPQARILLTWRQRLWAIDDQYLRYSVQQERERGASFPWEFEIEFASVRAAVVSDDRLYFHRSDGIFTLTGDGPTETGDGLYGLPEQVSTEPGALRPKLVAATPLGQVFVNERGVQLLDRSHQAQYLSGPIEQEFSPTTATRVLWMHQAQEIRITTTAGVTWVYDVQRQVWSKDTGQTFTDAAVWNGSFVGLIATAAPVHREVAGTYQDFTTTNVVTKMKTGKIQPAGYNGFFRLAEVDLLLDIAGACTVRVTITSHVGHTTITEVFDKAVTAGEARIVCPPRQQLCTAFDIQVEDVFAGAATAGFKLQAMTAWVRLREGPQRIRAAARAT